jgi:esterase/lipase superfamily enzyme
LPSIPAFDTFFEFPRVRFSVRELANEMAVRRIVLNCLAALFVACLVTGCASRPGPEALALAAAPPNAKLVKIYVATTRERAEGTDNVFTNSRARELNFAEFTIAIPPANAARQASWSAGEQRGFVIVEQAVLTKAEFRDRITANQRKGEKRDVGIFVHGFNNNFQEALFRLAQISADAGTPGAPVLFAWPSEARATAYLADRDAVTHSRDFLAEVLTTLASINDPRVQDAVTQARIRIVDISELSSGGFNHDRFIQLAAMYPQMSASADFGVAGTFVLDSAGANDGHIFAPASRPNAGH